MEWFLLLLVGYSVYARGSVGGIVLGFVMFCAGLVALAVLLVVLFFMWLIDEGLGVISRFVDRAFNRVFGGWA